MKIEINNIEFNKNARETTVLLSCPEEETVLILSKILLGSATYIEWNDQSTGVYNGVTGVQIDGNILVIILSEEGIQKIGHKAIQLKLSLPENDYQDLLEYLNIIFDNSLHITNKLFIPAKSKSIDYSKIKYLNLDGKNLILPPDHLDQYIALEKLFIRDNPKLNVTATVAILAKLPHLKQLQITIYGNIPHDLSKLTALESLHIEGEPDFETLPQDIGNLKKLSYIFLQSKKEINLPLQFSDLVALEFMHIRTNKWKLPPNFYKLSQLKYLDLYHCDIKEFPSEMNQMKSLETIILGRNQERDDSGLFTVLGQLSALKSIEVDICSLPESISTCTQIEQLKIFGDNDFDQKFYIPDSFGRLKQLKSLTFENCNFDPIPSSIFELNALQEFHLINCIFHEVPEHICKLTYLEEISITDCPYFSDIHHAFSKLLSLRRINFDNFPALQTLPKELDNLIYIEEVYLSDAENIKNVPENWINKMKN